MRLIESVFVEDCNQTVVVNDQDRGRILHDFEDLAVTDLPVHQDFILAEVDPSEMTAGTDEDARFVRDHWVVSRVAVADRGDFRMYFRRMNSNLVLLNFLLHDLYLSMIDRWNIGNCLIISDRERDSISYK